MKRETSDEKRRFAGEVKPLDRYQLFVQLLNFICMKIEIVFNSKLNELNPTGYDEKYVDENGMTHVIGDWNKMDNVLPF